MGEFLPGYEVSLALGLGAPRNVSAEIVDKLNKETNAALADPGIKSRLTDLGTVPVPMTTAEFGKFRVGEVEKWRKLIQTANIKTE